jgi:hypothetical protein
MEDVENRLSAIGYRAVPESAKCWRVSWAGATTSTARIGPAPQRRDPPCSPVLRFWMRRLGRVDASPLYRIRRAM